MTEQTASTSSGVEGAAQKRPRVLVLYGGRSSEHSISCVSAGGVLAALDARQWDVVTVGIDRQGRWWLTEVTPTDLAAVDGVLPEVRPTADPVALAPGDDGPHLHSIAEAGGKDLGVVDVVFPLLHGPWGEDGAIQGWLESVSAAYVGSGVLTSAVAMDKAAMKLALQAHGLPVGPFEVVHDGEWQRGRDRVLARVEFALSLPVFVKPVRAGSSIGITRVTNWADLGSAIDEARRHDPRVIVEESVAGAEIECGVLGAGRAHDDFPQASTTARIVLRDGRAFYDFDAKYLDDAADLVVPSGLPGEVDARVREMAVRAFTALGCEGLARVDFFVDDHGVITINEVNTMPGFTPTSMYPRMWQAAGVEYAELIDRLLTLALQRDRGLR